MRCWCWRRVLCGVRQPQSNPVADNGSSAEWRPTVRLVGSSLRVPFNGSFAPVCLHPWGVKAVREALLQFQPDIVHVHEPFVPGVSLSAAWFARAPVVATFHASLPVRCRRRTLPSQCAMLLADPPACAGAAERVASGGVGRRLEGERRPAHCPERRRGRVLCSSASCLTPLRAQAALRRPPRPSKRLRGRPARVRRTGRALPQSGLSRRRHRPLSIRRRSPAPGGSPPHCDAE